MSAFEIAIAALNPALFYRFRDGNFNTTIDDQSGGAFHLVKQDDPATRATYKVREKARNSAFVDSIAYSAWASGNQHYKSASNFTALNASTTMTLLISLRLEIPSSSGSMDHHIFLIGDQDTANSTPADNILSVSYYPAEEQIKFMFHVNNGSFLSLDTDVTGIPSDGTNRLYILRYNDPADEASLTSSKPGTVNLTEVTSALPSGSALDTVTSPVNFNTRSATTTTGTSPEFAVDAIAVWASDIGAASASNLHTLWEAEASADYYPSMMLFDGSTGYYSLTGLTYSGNTFAIVARVNMATKAGAGGRVVVSAVASGLVRGALEVGDASNADADFQDRLRFAVQNSSGTNVCRLFSNVDLADGAEHVIFAAFDGDAGTAVFRIDGADAINGSAANHNAPTTATLATATGSFGVGATAAGDGKNNGEIGFVGYRDASLTNYDDFMNGNLPLPIDEKNWAEWDGRSAGDIGMTTFDGSTGYYSDASVTTSGNAFTLVCRFSRSSFTGGATEELLDARGPTHHRGEIRIAASDHATAASKVFVQVSNSSGTIITRLVSNTSFDDGDEHVVFFAFDGDAGNAVFRVDGTDEDNTGHAIRIAPTTATLDAGASSDFAVASNSPLGASLSFGGKLGFCGWRDAYLTNYDDFSTGSTPNIDIDEIGWTEWGARPLFWNRTGEMSVNLGSEGNMTANGTIVPARPSFWSHTGQMDNNKGSAGDMTKNGTITMQEGGSPS